MKTPRAHALELLEAVRYSDLDLEAKSRLYDATPRLIGTRISGCGPRRFGGR